MKKVLCMLAILTPILFAFRLISPVEGSVNACSAPSNLVKTSCTSTTITYNWDDVDGAAQYRLTAHKVSTSETTTFTTNASTFTFENLTSGTYEFTFTTECSDGNQSQTIVISDINS